MLLLPFPISGGCIFHRFLVHIAAGKEEKEPFFDDRSGKIQGDFSVALDIRSVSNQGYCPGILGRKMTVGINNIGSTMKAIPAAFGDDIDRSTYEVAIFRGSTDADDLDLVDRVIVGIYRTVAVSDAADIDTIQAIRIRPGALRILRTPGGIGADFFSACTVGAPVIDSRGGHPSRSSIFRRCRESFSIDSVE